MNVKKSLQGNEKMKKSVPKFSLFWFIFWTILFGIGGLVYVIWVHFKQQEAK